MEITPDHPVYVEGKGWLRAENLAVGDRLRRADGGIAKVLAVERVKLAEPQLVYNFTVKGPHTYFVLEVGVLVHNDDICRWFGNQGETTVYRFANNETEATQSLMAVQPIEPDQLSPQNLERLLKDKKKVQDIVAIVPPGHPLLTKMGLEHGAYPALPGGMTMNQYLDSIRSVPDRDYYRYVSPYIATTDNIAKAALTSDANNLQRIVYGSDTFGYSGTATKSIYEFTVPNKLLYQPNLPDLSIKEGEVLVLDIWSVNQPLKWDAGDLPSQLMPTRVFPNPFAGTDIKYVQDVLKHLHETKLLEKMDVETTIALIEHIKTTRIKPQEARPWILKRY